MEAKENLPRPEELLRRWPDLDLKKAFSELFAIYKDLCAEVFGETAAFSAYHLMCEWILETSGGVGGREGKPVVDQAWRQKRALVHSVVTGLKGRHEDDWLQRLASLLAMLMHFAADSQEQGVLINCRRPGQPFSTYPTSPAVARLAAEALVSSLLVQEIPTSCSSPLVAAGYAKRALSFRILDPSMESGQLLLEIAQAVLHRVEQRHPPGTREAWWLGRALLKKLWRDCLWGVDRNGLASLAVETLVALLGAKYGLPGLRPARLLTSDALDRLDPGELPRFDGIANNPPWGEDAGRLDRERLRKRFRSLWHRTDTYVLFAEMGLRCLRPDGVFAIVLPSQAMSARNSTGLRKLLLEEVSLDQIILLPRAAFGDATVRGVLIIGRASPAGASDRCCVTVYPVVKRIEAIGSPRRFEVPQSQFRYAGGGSWSLLLSGRDPAASWGETIPLERLATVAAGVQLYCQGRGEPPQTPEVVRLRPFSLDGPVPGATPAVRGRDIQPFQVQNPESFVRFGKWLARVGQHDIYRRSSRIFVRELCRRDGRLSAALARDGFIPLHGVLTVVPAHIDPRVLVGLLNSGRTAEYVRACTASFSKVDFQRITVQELQQMPIPVAASLPGSRSDLGLGPPALGEAALIEELVEIVEELSGGEVPEEAQATALWDRLEHIVSALFDGSGGGGEQAD